jgi:hypothetical protein
MQDAERWRVGWYSRWKILGRGRPKLPKARVTLPLTTVGRRVGREVYTKRQLMTLSAYEATARNEAFIASRCVRFILDLTSLGVITGHPHRCVSVMLTFPLPRAPVRIATASGG